MALFCAHCCSSVLFPLGIVFSAHLVPEGFADIFSELYPQCDLLFTEVAQFICVIVICSALTFFVGWLIYRIIDPHYIGLREKSSCLIFHKVWYRFTWIFKEIIGIFALNQIENLYSPTFRFSATTCKQQPTLIVRLCWCWGDLSPVRQWIAQGKEKKTNRVVPKSSQLPRPYDEKCCFPPLSEVKSFFHKVSKTELPLLLL